MRIAILGSGGIGCFYGARLINAGHDVILVARGPHLQAMQRDGLVVEHPALQFRQPVRAMSMDDLLNTFRPAELDLLVVTLKGGATAETAAAIRAWAGPEPAPVTLSLQNGVDNEALLAAALGKDRILGGLAVRIGAHVERPGMVTATGVAQVVMGVWPRVPVSGPATDLLPVLHQAMRDADIDVSISDNIRHALWRKLSVNNGVNPLSAIIGLDTRSLTHDPRLEPVIRGLMEEARLASQIEDEPLSQTDVEEMFQLIYNFDAIKTSMLVDREQGRPLELDAICGAVLRRCEQQGLDAPYTRTMMAILGRH
ncbi:MAG: 2-dehydropantoate 2-reductase [Aquisalimonadaceae bacterium]